MTKCASTTVSMGQLEQPRLQVHGVTDECIGFLIYVNVFDLAVITARLSLGYECLTLAGTKTVLLQQHRCLGGCHRFGFFCTNSCVGDLSGVMFLFSTC